MVYRNGYAVLQDFLVVLGDAANLEQSSLLGRVYRIRA